MLEIEMQGPVAAEDNKELVPDRSKADMAKMKLSIAAINWTKKFDGKSGLERWEIIKSVIEEETDKCVPKKMRRVGSRPLWMNRNILQLIREKKAALESIY